MLLSPRKNGLDSLFKEVRVVNEGVARTLDRCRSCCLKVNVSKTGIPGTLAGRPSEDCLQFMCPLLS